MSRAFVKEDTDTPERRSRTRSSSGLPPGALNYLTAAGAARWRERTAELARAGDTAAAGEIEQLLAGATIVERPQPAPDSVTFGATVTLRAKDGTERTVQIVGVDEVEFSEVAVSWVSPLGRALLGAEAGEYVTLEDGRRAKIVQIA